MAVTARCGRQVRRCCCARAVGAQRAPRCESASGGAERDRAGQIGARTTCSMCYRAASVGKKLAHETSGAITMWRTSSTCGATRAHSLGARFGGAPIGAIRARNLRRLRDRRCNKRLATTAKTPTKTRGPRGGRAARASSHSRTGRPSQAHARARGGETCAGGGRSARVKTVRGAASSRRGKRRRCPSQRVCSLQRRRTACAHTATQVG